MSSYSVRAFNTTDLKAKEHDERATGAPAMRARGNGRHVAAGALALGLALAGPALVLPSAGASTAASAPTKAQVALACTRVADALADGPDPDVDPVGYALAQLRPLREIQTNDATLKKDIDKLATAYDTAYVTNNKKGAQAAVDKAGKALDLVCPGAF